jgi:DNA-binding XRE family transcriptional regulator
MHTLTPAECRRKISAACAKYRRDNNLTQSELANLLGITRDVYAQIEYCKKDTSALLYSKMQSIGISIYLNKIPCVNLTQRNGDMNA